MILTLGKSAQTIYKLHAYMNNYTNNTNPFTILPKICDFSMFFFVNTHNKHLHLQTATQLATLLIYSLIVLIASGMRCTHNAQNQQNQN